MTGPLLSDHAIVVLGLGASRLRSAARRSELARGAAAAARERGHRDVRIVEAPDGPSVASVCRSAIRAGAGLVVAVGGDGTVREATGALSGASIPLAIVPAGTGNLLASSLGIPRTAPGALAIVRDGVPRRIDHGIARWERRDEPTGPMPTRPEDDLPGPDAPIAGKPPPLQRPNHGRPVTAEPIPDGSIPAGSIPESPFVVATGVGLDARFLAAASREAKERYGIGAYLAAALGEARDLRPRPTLLTVDGELHELEAVVVLVANAGDLIPGVLRPRLPIRADDGRLHVFVVRGGIVGSVVGALELLAAGDTGWTGSGAALRLSATDVRVEMRGQRPDPVEIDGDRVGVGWLEARLRPASLDVLVPSGAR
jgi:diacylglycerol kinase (ATP)